MKNSAVTPFPNRPEPGGHRLPTPVQPPRHLSAEARRKWHELAEEYDITDAAGRQLLETFAEAFDRMRQAQRRIRKDGPMQRDRFGTPKPHALLQTERDSRTAMLAALRELHLDLEPLRDRAGRPPGGR
jgi:P27 family predicted phage terminase small subunit